MSSSMRWAVLCAVVLAGCGKSPSGSSSASASSSAGSTGSHSSSSSGSSSGSTASSSTSSTSTSSSSSSGTSSSSGSSTTTGSSTSSTSASSSTGSTGSTGTASSTGSTGSGPVFGGAGLDHHGDTGVVSEPLDYTGTPVAAWLPLADGGLEQLPGQAYDGGVSVDGVPLGATYYLQVGTDYLVGTARSFDLASDILGRIDTYPPGRASVIDFDLDQLDPWATDDYLELFSSNANTLLNGFQDSSVNAPLPGDTALDGLNVDFFVQGTNLIDGTHGDRAYLTQVAWRQSDAGANYRGLVAFAVRDDLTVVEGSTAEWDGGFSLAADAGALAAHLGLAAFDAYRTQINPAAQQDQQALYLFALPDGVTAGPYSLGPDLLHAQVDPPSATDVELGSMGYLDPFPAGWARLVEWDDDYTASYSYPGAASSAFSGGFYQVVEASAFAGTVQPVISPAQDLRINGLSLATDQLNVGDSPVFSWSAPSLGSNVQYRVGINQLFTQGGVTQRIRVATFYTHGTSITVPPGVLQTGQPYFVRLTSEVVSVDRSVAPYRQAIPDATCDLLSGAFVP